MSFNIEDVEIPIEFRFDLFKNNVEYTLIFKDFLHPDEKISSKSKKGSFRSYLVWRVICLENYIEEGIPYDIEYFQQMSKNAFVIAYVKYKFLNTKFRRDVYNLRNKNIDVEMTFLRKSKKKLIIKNISLLNDKEYSKDL